MKNPMNNVKNILKIWLLSLLIVPFLLWWLSYGADDLLYQLMRPAIESDTIIDIWENVNTVWQNFFKGSLEVGIELTNIDDFGFLSVPNPLIPGTHTPLCGKFAIWHYISGSIISWSVGTLITWTWLIFWNQRTSGTWLIWKFKSWGVNWSLITWSVIIGKPCPIECMAINSWSVRTCFEEWLSYQPRIDVEAHRETSIIVKVTKLLLLLTITLSVTMILWNGMSYIIQTWQWKEWKNLVKNIVYIVVWIIIALFSVIIITIIQSIPATLDDSDDGLVTDYDNSIDRNTLQGSKWMGSNSSSDSGQVTGRRWSTSGTNNSMVNSNKAQRWSSQSSGGGSVVNSFKWWR